MWRVNAGLHGVLLPEACASCGSDAARTAVEGPRGRGVLIPYCERCIEAVSRVETRRVAALFAGLLLCAATALAVPILLPRLSVWVFAALVFGSALAPALALALIRRRPGPGRCSEGRAVFWEAPASFWCASETWARAFADLNEVDCQPGERHEPVASGWPLAWPFLALAAAPALYSLMYPELMVLNLSPEPLVLYADGRRLGRLDATSLESPTAGLHVRLAAGQHALRVEHEDGAESTPYSLRLRYGRTHLFAPAHDKQCFWLETASYGRAHATAKSPSQSLPPGEFWVLPSDVNSWFRANPTSSEDHLSTGGTLTALRHGPCARGAAEALRAQQVKP